MKKILALALSMIMILTMIPALAEETILGTWYLKTVNFEDGNTVDVSTSIYDHKLVINEDETASVTSPFGNETYELLWSGRDDGEIIVYNEDGDICESLKMSDGTLIMSGDTFVNEGATLLYTRERGFHLAEININAALEDFTGEWTSVYINVDGNLSYIQQDYWRLFFDLPIMKIDGTSVKMEGYTDFDKPFEAEFADGALHYTKKFPFIDSYYYLTFNLLEDGMIALTWDTTENGGGIYIVYFTRSDT
ncbi:MAG: hypothetical protein K6E83_01015 [Clostridium sp.]|nr:hypothetical protein [Clostridium sp.]